MTRGETIRVDGIGDLRVTKVSGDFVHGRWVRGPLKGREACSSRHVLLGQEPPAPRRVSRKRAETVREALLQALTEGPVALASWAQEEGFSEAEARGAVGALRRAGHLITAQGGGNFAI